MVTVEKIGNTTTKRVIFEQTSVFVINDYFDVKQLYSAGFFALSQVIFNLYLPVFA